MTTNTTATSSRRRVIGLGTLCAAALFVGACSSAQKRSLGEQDIRDALTMQVDQAAAAHDFARDGSLDCTSAIAVDSTVSASCAGATRSGAAVRAAFTGTADVQKETCRARLTITVAGENVVDQPDVNCFAVK
jgi:hypothetical protein